MSEFMMLLKYTVEGGFWHFIGCWLVIGFSGALCLGVMHVVIQVLVTIAKLGTVREHKCKCKCCNVADKQ